MMIERYEKELLYLLDKRQVLIVVSETGSGKSTRIPQILFHARIYNHENDIIEDRSLPGSMIGYRHKLIGITQPRRVAAAQLAQRVSSNLGCSLGTTVGYAIRFKDVTSAEHTQIKFMTEGLLIREMMIDPLLEKYSVIVIDEAHERNLNTDILLGLLKCILLKRNDLKLIICSATLDVDAISKFFTYPEEKLTESNRDLLFGPPAILSAEGRTYPIKIYYKKQPVSNYLDATVETVKDIHENSRLSAGKILIFLTGQDEVDLVCQRLNDYALAASSRIDLKQLVVLPLYASLKPEQISMVFDEHGRNTRVCVISTNVAETSLTIDGIAFVVDCGFVKLRVFDHKTGVDTLVRLPISKSAAKQRAGRAGRTREGCVYRLYPKSEYDKLETNTIPEIQRSSLAEVVMLLKSLGVENVQTFPLISPMPTRNLCSALETLYALQAIDDLGRLSQIGELMAQLNLDPKFSKMLVSPQSAGCIQEVCRIAALLQLKDIHIRPPRQVASSLWTNESLVKLCAIEGDMPSYLNILNAFLNNNKSQKWAERRFLNYQALTNALEIASKLESQLKSNGISVTCANGRTELLHKAIVSGLFANAAYLHPSGDYRTIRGEQTVYVHPTSVFSELVEDKPKFVIFAELLNTTKPFMRHILSIERDWLLEAAPDYYTFGTEMTQR